MFFASGCSLSLSPSDEAATPFIITATLAPSIAPPASPTVPPPTLPPTAIPVEGTTSTQVNVRGDPTTDGAPLGIIGAFIKVQILGKDLSGNWYQIAYSKAQDGKGWVTAQYVVVDHQAVIPVVGGTPLPPTGIVPSGPSGVAMQMVNVRSGPGTDFNSLGSLNPKDVVVLTGKDPSGTWFQIQYPNGADGKGWVTAAFIQANNAENLPIIGQSGTAVGTGTSTSIPATITPTLIAALPDGDSAQSPAVKVVFLASGVHSLIYSSDVSAPQGDGEDWIQFTPFGPTIRTSLSCTGNGTLRVELWQSGSPLLNWGALACGGMQTIDVSPNQPYLFRLMAVSKDGNLAAVHYTLHIENAP